MAYLVNQARVSSLTIGGVNYTNNLLSFTVSDSSANKNGIIQTNGTLLLGENPNGGDLGDYARVLFKRGTVVILNVTDPETNTIVRHPRGYLYVISTGYQAENSALQVTIGCRLTLAALTEEVDEILPLVPVPLEAERQDYSNCSASFASAGQCLYQDNQGALQVVEFFDGDLNDSVAPGEWTSVLGVTALSAVPTLGGNAIPDTLLLSYQVPTGAVGSSDLGKIDETITDSYYFLNYPTTSYVRVSSGLSNITGISTTYSSGGITSGCGNTPAEPAGNPDLITCNEGYQVSQEPVILPCTSQEISRTYYSGPSSQVERTRTDKYGPAVELNGQYFSDLFAYCRYTWATACNPNGSCAYEGMEIILQSYDETYNYYGPSGELVQTIQDNYLNILNAAQQFDWRAGVIDGIPKEFRRINYTGGTTTSTIRVGSGTARYYRSKATSYQQTIDNNGFYYVDGSRIYFSRYDSNGNSTTSGLQSITGVSQGAVPLCSWQYNSSTKNYELVCNYPDVYASVQADGYWPTRIRLKSWQYGTNAINGVYNAYIDFVDEIPEGSTLSLHQNTSEIAVTAQVGTFYRDQRTVTDYIYSGDGNIQTTTTYSSIASNNIGIYRSSLDALNGVITVQRRISRTITANPIAPDRISSSNSSTVEQSSEYPIFLSTYQESIDPSGPYIIKESIPVPLLFASADTLTDIVETYSNYIIRFIKGDARGYTIGEALRPEIIENWRPGMPFRYCDQEKGKILALRMDACNWGVTPTECAVVTNGIWIGDSDGTLLLPSNLSGNSTPSLDEDPPTPPTGPTTPPSITNEVYVPSGPISFVFTVNIGTKILVPFDEAQSITTVIEPIEIDTYQTLICFVSGLVVAPGSLLGTTSTGSIPISANGSLVLAGATVITGELFPNTFTPPVVGASVAAPRAIIDMPVLNPTVISGASVSPNSGDIQVEALFPRLVGAGILVDMTTTGDIQVAGFAPSISRGGAAFAPSTVVDVVSWDPPYVGGWADPYWANTSLFLTFDSNFTDSSSKAIPVQTVGAGATISTTFKKFGNASAFFNSVLTGASYVLYTDASGHLAPGLGDFTAEFWWYAFSVTAGPLWANRTNREFAIWQQNLSQPGYVPTIWLAGSQYYAGTNTTTSNTSSVVPLLTWNHIALTRATGVYRLFINGVQTILVNNQVGLNNTTSWDQINRYGAVGTTTYGHMDECRFTKGVARYTSNFTPSATPFPNPFPR